MLIAAFLDPVCFAILTEPEIEKAKKLILKKQNYFEIQYIKLNNLIRRVNRISFSEFWRSNCNIFKFLVLYVKYYSIISAFSVSDEFSFSKANFLPRKERSSFSSENLRYTMILNQKKALQEQKFLD